MNYKFYKIDINSHSNQSVELANLYLFNARKERNIFIKTIVFDKEGQAVQFIPQANNCSILFPNDYPYDCGVLNNFQMCILRSRIYKLMEYFIQLNYLVTKF